MWRAAFAVTLLVQCTVLYVPRPVGPDGVPNLDKAVHALIFGAVAFTALRAGFPARPVVVLLLAHAAGSELIQHFLLPHRSGDARDAVADSVGVLLGVALASLARRRPPAPMMGT